MRTPGGYCQWVLDVVCETVEWSYQPLGFNSLALRSALGQERKSSAANCAKVMVVSQATFSPLGKLMAKAPA